IRAYSLPARDLRANAVAQALFAEVRPPWPGHDRDVDRASARRDAELSIAEEGDRAHVALGEPVRTDEVPARGLELVDRIRQLHVEELRRIREPLEVLRQPKDR